MFPHNILCQPHKYYYYSKWYQGFCAAYRKRALLLYLHNTRQRLLRLHVLIEWSNKVCCTIHQCTMMKQLHLRSLQPNHTFIQRNTNLLHSNLLHTNLLHTNLLHTNLL